MNDGAVPFLWAHKEGPGMKTVYLNDHICPHALERLQRHVRLVDNFDHPEEIDAIIVRQQWCTREMIAQAVNCRLIQMHGTGLERIDLKAAREYGIPVRSTRGGNAQSVAELTIALMLALSRKLTYINDGVRKGAFPRFGMPETEGREITGKTLGLVGGGQIAQRVATMARAAFDMHVLVYDPYMDAAQCNALGMERVETITELARRVDYMSIHVPYTESTANLIDRTVLRSARPGMMLINTARGGIVDEEALYEALTQGPLAAAALDVFKEQPPRADHPLLGLDNFIGTVHIGGSTAEALERNGRMTVDSVFDVLGIDDGIKRTRELPQDRGI